MLEIKNYLTKVNYTKRNDKKNKYIVIHYVGSVSTALNNAKYFNNVHRGASAHYFVDDNNIYRVVEDKDNAWHVGSKKYYNDCRNNNSIGIEMCCKKDGSGKIYMTEQTIKNTIELTKELMKKYSIDAEHVVRHYDISKKLCPKPFIDNVDKWNDFKRRLTTQETTQKTTQEIKPYLVKVTANALNVRTGIGTNYKINTTIKKGEVYTIIEEKNGWGKLKSGAGWISLKYVKKI